jgi:hypothetical protein|tara:strand:+ start:425 stop:790 length:366 start_codon:yes stop_codon:yes gene_type:complete
MKITKTRLSQIIKEEIESFQKEDLKEGLLGDLVKGQAKKYICGDLSEKIQGAVNLQDYLPFEVPRFIEVMFDDFLGQAICELGTELLDRGSTPEVVEFIKLFDKSGLFENLEGEKINVNDT